MLRPRMRYRNVRADVLDILQKDSRDGEVEGPNRPRGRFGAQESRRGARSLGPFETSFRLVDLLASSRPSSGDGCEWIPHLGGAPWIGVSVKTPTTSAVEPLILTTRFISEALVPGPHPISVVSQGPKSTEGRRVLPRMSNQIGPFWGVSHSRPAF